MLDLINNTTKLLGDDLKREIKTGSRLRIAASCFSIYAFDALKDELGSIEELKFLFTTPTMIGEQIKDGVKKQQREFYIPKLSESGLCGTEFEIRLKNQMTQKAIARECAAWLKEKVRIKTLKEPVATQSMINIESGDAHMHYTPVGGFTTADLGFERSNSNLTGIIKTDDAAQSKFFIGEFDRLWNNSDKLEDITDAVVDYISSCYKENSPEFIYFIILYNIFKDFLRDLDEDHMPNEATGFKNSLIWNKLYNFQKDGAVGIINKLERYNGCILADSVGLGKTFTALAVMQYYSLRNKSILVLCPKRLEQNWTQYQGNSTTNLFYKDRIRFDVLFHTDLGRTSGRSGNLDLSTVNWGNYDLVVIDESHNFRNNNSAHKDRDTRYDFLMKRIMQDGVKTKVLMLSATPVNNRYNDLKNQLLLAYCGDYSEMNATLGTSKDVQTIFRNAQKVFNAWSKLPIAERKAKDLIDNLDLDFSIILDSVTFARSRKHIQKFYDTSDIGTFPTRLPTISRYPNLTDAPGVMKYKEIYDKLLSMTMNVYIFVYLRTNGYADRDGNLLDAYREAQNKGEFAPLPIELSPYAEGVHRLVQGIFDEKILGEMVAPATKTKITENYLNDNFYKKEFQELWKKINHQYAYTVSYDSEKLIRLAINALDQKMYVTKLTYVRTVGSQTDTLDFAEGQSKTSTLQTSRNSASTYDLIGKISQGTTLTRRTVAAILKGIFLCEILRKFFEKWKLLGLLLAYHL